MAFDTEIKEYEAARQQYQTSIINQMNREEYIKYNEVLFSTYSCAIEGNSFSVDDTRELKEKGLGMIPAGKTLFEAFEMLDHFEAFEYMMQNTQHPIDEELLKEINRRVTRHTLSYHAPEAVAGEYTTTDMTAGDTVFGNHKELIARVPKLLESTEEAIVAANVHPMILAARFHGFTNISIRSAMAMVEPGVWSATTYCCAWGIPSLSSRQRIARNTLLRSA